MSNKYFVWHWDEGFTTFATAEEAKSEAKRLFDEDYDVAMTEGFDEDCLNMCWGKISQQVVVYETGKKVAFEGGLVNGANARWEPALSDEVTTDE